MKRIILLTALIATTSTQGIAQQPRDPSPPVIIVSGSAQLEVTPDEATVRLGVVRQEGAAQAAQEQANRTAQAILAEIAKLGIPSERIRTSRVTLSPVYAPARPETGGAPRIASYSASNVVSVHLTNLAQIGPVIDAGLRAGSNRVEGIQFRVKDDLPVREQALKQAVAEARRKAEAMAEPLGVRLGAVQEVTEGGSSIMPKGEAGGGFVMMAREATPTPVSAGQLEVTANVTVKYLILPR